MDVREFVLFLSVFKLKVTIFFSVYYIFIIRPAKKFMFVIKLKFLRNLKHELNQLSIFNFQVYKISLRGDGKTNLYWSLDYDKSKVFFEVHVPLPENSWFAVGFSDYGDLYLADLCVFWVDWKRQFHFEDVWTSKEGRISVDKMQNCLDFHYTFKDTGIKFLFSRNFDTCDTHDYKIEV